MALRMVYDKALKFAATQYQAVLGNQLAQYGAYFYFVEYFLYKRSGEEDEDIII